MKYPGLRGTPFYIRLEEDYFRWGDKVHPVRKNTFRAKYVPSLGMIWYQIGKFFRKLFK